MTVLQNTSAEPFSWSTHFHLLQDLGHHNNKYVKPKGFHSLGFTAASCQPAQGVRTSNIIMLVKSHPVKSGAQFRCVPQEGAGPLPALPSYYSKGRERKGCPPSLPKIKQQGCFLINSHKTSAVVY